MGVSYSVTHESNVYSTIIGVEVNLIVTDIPLPNQDSYIQQTFGIDFFNNGSAGSQSYGNQVQRIRSGNPGYLMGSSILYGNLDASQVVIDESISGFEVPSPIRPPSFITLLYDAPDGCPIDPAASGIPIYLARGSAQVHFGYDIATGCSLSLNRSELINMCCEGQSNCDPMYPNANSPYTLSNGLPVFLSISGGYIGAYGNADPLDITQWIAVSPASIAGFSRKWNDQLGVCSGMISSMNIRFLVAYTAEATNPQNKIIAAAIEYGTSDWTLGISPYDDVSRQTFPLAVSVSFVFEQQQQQQEYYPPPPPVLFTVPYDVFYPFISGSPPTSYTGVAFSIVLVAVIFAMLCASE